MDSFGRRHADMLRDHHPDDDPRVPRLVQFFLDAQPCAGAGTPEWWRGVAQQVLGIVDSHEA